MRCRVVALVGGVAACGEVTPPPPPGAAVVSVEIAAPEWAGLPGRSLQLTAEGRDSAGAVVAGAEFVWTSGDSNRARVDATGLVQFAGAPGPVAVWAREVTAGVADTVTLRVVREGDVRWAVSLGRDLQQSSGVTVARDGSLWVLTPYLTSNGRARSELFHLTPNGSVRCQAVLDRVYENLVVVPPSDDWVWVTGSRLYQIGPACQVVRTLDVEAPFEDALFISGAVADDGTFYGATSFHVLALTPALAELWRSPRSPRAGWLSPPTVAGDRVYAKDSSDSLYVFDRIAGSVIWTAPDPDDPPDGPFMQGPVVAHGRVAMPLAFSFMALDTAGAFLWRTSPTGRGVSEPVVLADGHLINQEQEAMYRRDPGGNTVWAVEAVRAWYWAWYGGPALAEGGVVYAAARDGFYAFTVDGTYVWRTQAVPGDSAWFAGAPAIAPDGTIYTWGAVNVYALFGSRPPDPTSPWPMWRHDAQRTGRAP
jgi:outer membrane protein assembly factor BamB